MNQLSGQQQQQQKYSDDGILFQKLLYDQAQDFYQYLLIKGHQNSKKQLEQLIEKQEWKQIQELIKNENFRTEFNIPKFLVEEEQFKIISSDQKLLEKLMELVWIENTFQDLDYANKIIFYSELLYSLKDLSQKDRKIVEQIIGSFFIKYLPYIIQLRNIDKNYNDWFIKKLDSGYCISNPEKYLGDFGKNLSFLDFKKQIGGLVMFKKINIEDIFLQLVLYFLVQYKKKTRFFSFDQIQGRNQMKQLFQKIVKQGYEKNQIETLYKLSMVNRIPYSQLSLITGDPNSQQIIALFSLLKRENPQLILDMIKQSEYSQVYKCYSNLQEYSQKFQCQESINYLFLLIGLIYKKEQKELQQFHILFQIQCIIDLQKFKSQHLDFISYYLSNESTYIQLLDKQRIHKLYDILSDFFFRSGGSDRQLIYKIQSKIKRITQQTFYERVQTIEIDVSEEINKQYFESEFNKQWDQKFALAEKQIEEKQLEVYEKMNMIMVEKLNLQNFEPVNEEKQFQYILDQGKQLNYDKNQQKEEMYQIFKQQIESKEIFELIKENDIHRAIFNQNLDDRVRNINEFANLDINQSFQNANYALNYIKSYKVEFSSTQFSQQLVAQIQKIMLNSDVFRKIVYYICDIIEDNLIDKQNQQIIYCDEDLTKFLIQQIQDYFSTLNKKFANLGIILNQMANLNFKYIFKSDVLIFQLRFQYKISNAKLEQLKQQKEFQRQCSRAKYEKDQKQLIQVSAQKLATLVDAAFVDQIQSNKKQELRDSLMQMSLSCKQFVQKMDYEVLKNNNNEDKIYRYISDQRNEIKIYAEEETQRIKQEALQKQKQKFTFEYQKLSESIIYNINLMMTKVKQFREDLSGKQIFEIIATTKADDYYDKELFQLIWKCLIGAQQSIDLQQTNIDRQYFQIFQQDFKNVNLKVSETFKILQLIPWLEELYNQIVHLEKNKNNNNNNFIPNQEDIIEQTNQIRIKMIGCQEQCPFCKRKCDNEANYNHKHACLNGHYMRGMNLVLIEGINKPSPYVCEELSDDTLIKSFEINSVKTWKEYKGLYPDWNFNDRHQSLNMIEIWNKVGNNLCEKYYKKIRGNVQFQVIGNLNAYLRNEGELNRFLGNNSPIHYILILDDSGSMGGSKWDDAKKGALACMEVISQNQQGRVSVIIFNSDARVVIDFEKPDIYWQEKKICYQGGGTSFNNAFLLGYNQLMNRFQNNFVKNIILFYTDGEDGYPQEAVQKFCSLDYYTKQKIQVRTFSQGGYGQNASLQQITDNLQRAGISADLKEKVDPGQLQTVWREVIYHNLK